MGFAITTFEVVGHLSVVVFVGVVALEWMINLSLASLRNAGIWAQWPCPVVGRFEVTSVVGVVTPKGRW